MSKYDTSEIERFDGELFPAHDGQYVEFSELEPYAAACKRKDVVINDLITIALFVCQDCVHKDNCFREGKKVEKCKSWARIQAAKAELDREEI